MKKFTVVNTPEEYKEEKKLGNEVYLLEDSDFRELDIKIRALDISILNFQEIKTKLTWHANRARTEIPYESKVTFDFKFVDLSDLYKAVDAVKATDIEVGVSLGDTLISVAIRRR